MKEFGVYLVNSTYLREFLADENKLAQLKIPRRPFVCVKLSGRNWLIPLSSINPNSNEYSYNARLKKQLFYNEQDRKNPPKAMDIFTDLFKTGDKTNKSVAMYYNAIPIKSKYCRKYYNKSGRHFILDNKTGAYLKGNLLNYLSAYRKGQYPGFIGQLIAQGKEDYKNYPIKSYVLQRALYKNELQLRAVRRQKIQEHEQFEQEQQRRRKLKRRYKGLTDDELVAATLDQCDEKLSQELAQQKTQRKNQSENQQIGQAQQAEQVKPLQNRQKGAQKQKSKPDGSGKK